MKYPSSGGARRLCPRSLLRLKLELRFRISLERSRRRRTLLAGGTTQAKARKWNVKPQETVLVCSQCSHKYHVPNRLDGFNNRHFYRSGGWETQGQNIGRLSSWQRLSSRLTNGCLLVVSSQGGERMSSCLRLFF